MLTMFRGDFWSRKSWLILEDVFHISEFRFSWNSCCREAEDSADKNVCFGVNVVDYVRPIDWWFSVWEVCRKSDTFEGTRESERKEEEIGKHEQGIAEHGRDET